MLQGLTAFSVFFSPRVLITPLQRISSGLEMLSVDIRKGRW